MSSYDMVVSMLENLSKTNSYFSGCEIIQRNDGGVIIKGPSVSSSLNYPEFSIGIPANYQGNLLDEVVYFNGYKSNNGGNRYHNGSKVQVSNINEIMDLNPNTLVITGTSCYDSYSISETANNIKNYLGIGVNNSVTVGFSDGGTGAAHSLVKQINAGKTSGNILLLYDAHHLTSLSNDEVNTLANGNTTVILVHNESNGDSISKTGNSHHGLSKLISANIPVIDISAKYGTGMTGHTNLNNQALTNNIIGYILGTNDEPLNSNAYEYGVYDAETNTTKKMTVSELKDYFVKNGLYSNLVNLDRYTTSSSFEVQNVNIESSNFYTQLGTIADLISSKENVSSNSTYVISSMNSIRQQIKATANNCAGATVVAGRFSSGILASIGAYVNKFYNVYGNLLSSLEAETKSIVSLSEAIDDMDLDLKNGASVLGTFNESENPYLKVEDTLKKEEEKAKKSGGGYSGGGSYSNDDSTTTTTTSQEATTPANEDNTPSSSYVNPTYVSNTENTNNIESDEYIDDEFEFDENDVELEDELDEVLTDMLTKSTSSNSNKVVSGKKGGNTLKTVGIIGAVAAGTGAAIYGTKKIVDNKNDNNSFDDEEEK